MSKRSDALYVRDIKEAIDAIFSYTRGITLDDFKLDRMRYSAVIRDSMYEICRQQIAKYEMLCQKS